MRFRVITLICAMLLMLSSCSLHECDFSLDFCFTENEHLSYCACGRSSKGEHALISTVVAEPTCSAFGEEKHTCSVCGYSYSTEIAMLEHTPERVEGHAPSCTAVGRTDGSCCSVCGEALTESEPISVVEHNFVDGKCTVCQTVVGTDGLEYSPATSPDSVLVSFKDWSSSEIVIPTYSPDGKKVVGILNFSEIFTAWVPLPAPGAPIKIKFIPFLR